ncbi:MAG: hypothetical protein ABW073_01375 [Acidimicrobiia bacterium]
MPNKGSSKKASKRAGRGGHEQGAVPADDARRDDRLLEALELHHATAERMVDLLHQLVESRAVVELQLERLLTLQQRTNALWELSLGSAFDVELGAPRRGQ